MKKSLKLLAGSYQSPFGLSFLLLDDNQLLSLIFADDEASALADFQKRFPHADISIDQSKAMEVGKMIFELGKLPAYRFEGTGFQQQVWNALLQIPSGKTTTYARIAETIGKPKAVRAVGTAIGNNPMAYLVPCHRVLRTDGGIGGYRWGNDIKIKMLAAEGVIL